MFQGVCVVARVNSGTFALAKGRYARGAIKGFPDIVCLYKGRMYGIEVKSDTGKQSDEQVRMQAWFMNCGGIYVLTSTLRDIQKIIK
jgi:hypothetical protein